MDLMVFAYLISLLIDIEVLKRTKYFHQVPILLRQHVEYLESVVFLILLKVHPTISLLLPSFYRGFDYSLLVDMVDDLENS